MTNEEKFVALFKELELPIKKDDERCSEDYTVYLLLGEVSEVVFNKSGDVEDYYGGVL